MTDTIVTDPEVLRTKSRPTTIEEVEELKLIDRMRSANLTAWVLGCGVTAIQIGVPVRFSWIFHKNKEVMLLNPEIVYGIGITASEESCLSIPNKKFIVERYLEIEYMNNGKRRYAKGMLAKIIQHEIDHMNGILVSDKAVAEMYA